MVRDGQITDSTAWTYVEKGRDPRSALGVREDGTLVLYAVDGRRSGYSGGLSQLDLAEEMLSHLNIRHSQRIKQMSKAPGRRYSSSWS